MAKIGSDKFLKRKAKEDEEEALKRKYAEEILDRKCKSNSSMEL
jgi:hypothetical protein